SYSTNRSQESRSSERSLHGLDRKTGQEIGDTTMNTKLETVEKIEPHEDQSSGSQKNRTTMNPFINDPQLGKQEFQIDIKMAQRFLTLLAEDSEMGFSF